MVIIERHGRGGPLSNVAASTNGRWLRASRATVLSNASSTTADAEIITLLPTPGETGFSTANIQFKQVKRKHPRHLSPGAVEGYVHLSGAPYGVFPR